MKHLLNYLLVIVLCGSGCTVIKPFEKLDRSCSATIELFNSDVNSTVKSIKFTGLNGTIITYSQVGQGWTQLPNFPNDVTWFVPSAGFPTGNPVAGTFKIWFRNVAGNTAKVEFLDSRGVVLCTRQVVLNCEKSPVKISCDKEDPNNCCQFALRLLNNIPNTFKKIQVTPHNPSEITGVNLGIDDDLDWSLTQSGSTYTFNYINTTGNGFIPNDAVNCIDADFTISVNNGSNNPKINLAWIDGNDVIQKSEEITLVCKDASLLEDESFEYDWAANTISKTGAIPDSMLFAGAEALPCNLSFKMVDIEATCPTINSSISCVNNKLTLNLTCTPASSDIPSPVYYWTVDGNAIGGSTTSISASLTKEGQNNATVFLEVHGISPDTGNDSIYCTQTSNIPYCKPSADFVSTKPVVVCNPQNTLAGWDVSLIHVTPCTNIADYKWDFGDGTAVVAQTGMIVDPTHRYTTPGTYNTRLDITDQYGCKYSYTEKVIIPKDCEPDFHINYEWCEDGQNKNQKYLVKVEFTNLSVSFCESSYMWDYGDGSVPDASGVHIYNTFPGQPYKVTLTMKDTKMCPSGKSKSYTFSLKPVDNKMSVVSCPDGIVKFKNPCDVYWELPTWQLLTQDPSYYCSPIPFDPWTNIQINAFLGIKGINTSIPQLWINAWSYHSFQLRMKDGTSFPVTSTCKEEQGSFATGTCKKTKMITVNVTCCTNNFNKADKRYNTFNGKNYRMKIRFKTHYRERHSAQGLNPGACIDYYLSAFVPEWTHLMTRTTLQRQRKSGKIKYWTWSLAEWISTGVTNPNSPATNFLTTGGTDGCNCVQPVHWGNQKTRPSRIMLTFRGNTPGLFRIDKSNLLQSFHQVKIPGQVPWNEYIDKPIGYCNPQ